MMEVRTHITIEAEEYASPVAFPVVHRIDIEQSRKMMEETALVEVPNVRKRFGYIQTLKPGAAIKIEIGYNEELVTEFVGTVHRFSEGNGLMRMECESTLTYELKRSQVDPVTLKDTTLKAVLEHIAPDAEINCPDVAFDEFRIEEGTPYLALKKLARKYGFDVFVRGARLFCVVPYTDTEASSADTIVFDFQRNAVRYPTSLEFKRAEEVRMKIRGISQYKEGGKTKKREYEAGDDDGGIHTVHYYNKTEAELKALVDEKLAEYKYEGVRGWFFGFWKPRPMIGQVMELKDTNKPTIDGKYFIDRLTTTVNGSTGFKRRIYPGRKAAA